MNSLTRRLLDREVVLIDGATGTELERHGVPMTEGIWCGLTNATHPNVVQRVHEINIEAGAELIIANTYASSRHLLAQAGEQDRFEELNRRGIELALAARQRLGASHVLVAGSISTTQMNGEHPPVDVARANFADQARIQTETGADLIILEMLRDIDQTQAALDAVHETGLPVWAGYSCVIHDGVPMLFDGHHTLAEALRALERQPIELVAIMHSEIEDTDPALDVVREHWAGPIGVYAQRGRYVDPNWVFDSTITPEEYARDCLRWVGRGVQVIGGCCGIGPAHIAHLKRVLPTHTPRMA